MTAVVALLLADGRFPDGAHAHSGGIEWAAGIGDIDCVADLSSFLVGRLATTGAVAAGLAAAACTNIHSLELLDAEADARTASPALREVSRRQGTQLARAASAILRDVDGVGAGHHHAVALGAVARAAGLVPVDAALLALYGVVTGPATAAVRLLGLDPFAVHRVIAGLAPTMEALAGVATSMADGPPADLAAAVAPLLDVGAEHQARAEMRLFAS